MGGSHLRDPGFVPTHVGVNRRIAIDHHTTLHIVPTHVGAGREPPPDEADAEYLTALKARYRRPATRSGCRWLRYWEYDETVLGYVQGHPDWRDGTASA